MSKVLKRLYLGDVVKSFGTKQLRKLTTEEPTESIVGTWVFNDTLSYTKFYIYGLNFSAYGNDGTKYDFYRMKFDDDSFKYQDKQGLAYHMFVTSTSSWHSNVDKYGKAITIHSEPGENLYVTPDYQTFITWLKANATKQ